MTKFHRSSKLELESMSDFDRTYGIFRRHQVKHWKLLSIVYTKPEIIWNDAIVIVLSSDCHLDEQMTVTRQFENSIIFIKNTVFPFPRLFDEVHFMFFFLYLNHLRSSWRQRKAMIGTYMRYVMFSEKYQQSANSLRRQVLVLLWIHRRTWVVCWVSFRVTIVDSA